MLWLAALGIGCLWLCSKAQASELAYCAETGPTNFAPSLIRLPGSKEANLQIYDGLLSFDPNSADIVPSLAQKWDISADGRTYTFYLRRGVKWQSNAAFTPSRDFNADDVLFMFERQWKPNHPYFKVTSADHRYFVERNLDSLIQDVQKVNNYTVKITLKQINATFLSALALPYMLVQSKEYADAMLKAGTPERIDIDPIGTGPFQVVSYQKDELLRFKAFANYWQGRAKLDSLVFRITPDPERRWRKMQQGLCQMMAHPHPADIYSMRKNADFRVITLPNFNIGYLAFNNLKKPFDDVRVRKALGMAIDKSNIISTVYLDIGTVAVNPIPQSEWAYNSSISDFPYNPSEAKRLLAQANYPNGFQTDIWVLPVPRPYNPSSIRTAELIRADLAKIGVKATIADCAPMLECYRHMLNGDHQMAVIGAVSDSGDPDGLLTSLLTCKSTKGGDNIANWCYPPFDALIEQARSTNSIQERTRLYQRAQVLFKEQAPWLPLASSMRIMVVSKDVTGVPTNPMGRLQFYTITR